MNAIKEFASRVKAIMAAAKAPANGGEHPEFVGGPGPGVGGGVGGRRRESIDTQTTRGHGGAGQPSQYLSDYITPAAGLQQFRLLVGITQDKSFRAPHGFLTGKLPTANANSSSRPAPNTGIYARVCTAELKCKSNYKNASRLINGCLGLQIVVAAALTALGAADGSRSAITVFGAINTIIAGFLTYLKGSGLPNRLRYYQHEWSKIREYIEQRERDLSCGQGFDIMAEVALIREMFESVKSDVESSQADRFVGVGSSIRPAASATQYPPMQIPGQHMLQQGQQMAFQSKQVLSDASQEAQKFRGEVQSHGRDINDLEKGLVSFGKGWFSEKQAEASSAIRTASHDASHGLSANVAGLKARLEEKMRDIGHLEKELEQHGKTMVEAKRGELNVAVQSTIRQAEEIGQEIDTKTRAVETATRSAVQERSDAARAVVLENELAAKEALARGQAAANEAVHQQAEKASGVIAQSEAVARQAAKEYIDRAFDGVSPSTSGAAKVVAAPGAENR